MKDGMALNATVCSSLEVITSGWSDASTASEGLTACGRSTSIM